MVMLVRRRTGENSGSAGVSGIVTAYGDNGEESEGNSVSDLNGNGDGRRER